MLKRKYDEMINLIESNPDKALEVLDDMNVIDLLRNAPELYDKLHRDNKMATFIWRFAHKITPAQIQRQKEQEQIQRDEETQNRINEIESSEAYLNRFHPEHPKVIQERANLYAGRDTNNNGNGTKK